MIEVTSATDIAGSPDTVWSVLTDLEAFSRWNPFIRKAHGSTAVGGTVHVRVRSSFGLPLAFRARVLDSDAGHRLHWRGNVLAPWLASGEHTFTIESTGEGHCRFIQREEFGGLLPRLASRLLAREARRGFDAMNKALALRVCEQEART